MGSALANRSYGHLLLTSAEESFSARLCPDHTERSQGKQKTERQAKTLVPKYKYLYYKIFNKVMAVLLIRGYIAVFEL